MKNITSKIKLALANKGKEVPSVYFTSINLQLPTDTGDLNQEIKKHIEDFKLLFDTYLSSYEIVAGYELRKQESEGKIKYYLSADVSGIDMSEPFTIPTQASKYWYKILGTKEDDAWLVNFGFGEIQIDGTCREIQIH